MIKIKCWLKELLVKASQKHYRDVKANEKFSNESQLNA